VDDTFVFCDDEEDYKALLTLVNTKYSTTQVDPATSFLSINLEYLQDGSVKLTQPKLIDKLVQEYPQAITTKKPNSPHRRKYSSTPEESAPIQVIQYLHVLGELLWLTKSRPELQTFTSLAATKSTHPTEEDFKDLMYCINYIHHTRDTGLTLSPNYHLPLRLYTTVDASYLLHGDSRSHTGYTVSFGESGSFYSNSSKQPLVTTSSTHSEARSVYTLIQIIILLTQLCKEINLPLLEPAYIFEDNAAVITLANDEFKYVRKCKHFLMLINYIKEQVQNGLIIDIIIKIASKENKSDLLSKPLYGSDFQDKATNILNNTV
jgi:hypothetical protein